MPVVHLRRAQQALTSKINPPWYFCNGWWSPWCFLDEWYHRLFAPVTPDDEPDDGFDWDDAMDTSEESQIHVPWICRKHDDAAMRGYYRRHPEDPDAYDLTKYKRFVLW